MLTNRRRDNVYRRANSAAPVAKESLEFLSIAISPSAGIETSKQVSKRAIHSGCSLFAPALTNCSRVLSLARNTRRPSAVIR